MRNKSYEPFEGLQGCKLYYYKRLMYLLIYFIILTFNPMKFNSCSCNMHIQIKSKEILLFITIDIDVAIGDNLTCDQRAEFMDLAKQFQGRLSEQSRRIT